MTTSSAASAPPTSSDRPGGAWSEGEAQPGFGETVAWGRVFLFQYCLELGGGLEALDAAAEGLAGAILGAKLAAVRFVSQKDSRETAPQLPLYLALGKPEIICERTHGGAFLSN